MSELSLEYLVSGPSPELISEVVRAGAGAGKTTKLTNTVLNVAQNFFAISGRAPRIVVTTFTRKATEELRERLLLKSCELGDSRLVDFVTSRSQLHISTIHGVLSLFLRRFGHWLDLDAGFTILDASAADRMARKVLRDILVDHLEFDPLVEEWSVDQLVKMVRLYAEASSAARQLHPVDVVSLQSGIRRRYQIWANQTLPLIASVEQETANEKWLEYMQHLKRCAQLLLREEMMNGPEWYERLRIHEKPRFLSKSAPFSEGLHNDLKDLLKRAEGFASEPYRLENMILYSEKSQLFQEMAEHFKIRMNQRKQVSGQMEMSDLENLALKAIREHPEVARAFAADWDYWLVDEYQDTSPVQVELLKSLVGNKPIFIVGDPQQSIYLFRGARSEVFAEEEASLVARGGLRSELKKNYRSRPELLMFFNDLFKKYDGGFLEMEPKERPSGEAPIVARFFIMSETDEAPYAPLANMILSHKMKGAKFDDFCILARTNRELQVMAQYFETLNIPTHLHSSEGFYRRREILDILSILKFMMNPFDNHNLLRILRSPWCKLGDQEIAQVLSNRTVFYWPILQVEKPQHPAILKLLSLLKNMKETGVYEALKSAIVEWRLVDLSHFHDSTGRRESNIWKLLMQLKEKEKSPGFNYLSFVQKAFQGWRSAEGDEESDAVAALEPNRVNLMTIHKSKGLKFKHVLLPNLDKRLTTSESRGHAQPFLFDEVTGQFTLGIRLGEERKLRHSVVGEDILERLSERERAEHLRLLYVALTRAEDSVALQWQEPLQKSTWAANLPLNLDLGIHREEQYSYLVEREMPKVEPYQLEMNVELNVRSLWQSKLSEGHQQKRFSVTRLLEESNVAAPFAMDSNSGEAPKDIKAHIEAPVLGQKLHSLLERLKYSNDFPIEEYSERWFAERKKEFQRAIEYVLSLREPPIRDLIQRGHVEWGFQLQTKRGVMEGQIDLWGQIESEIWLVDYKSGSSRFSEKAFSQLNLYAYALRESGLRLPIKLAVIYALEGRTEIREAVPSQEICQQYGL